MEEEVLRIEIDRFKKGKDVIAWAAKNKVYRELLVMVYANEVWRKRLKRLQDLPEEKKKEIWEVARKEANLDKQGMLELSKVIYLISENI